MPTTEQYTVGWICALETEYVAARAFLEERHDPPETLSPNDNNHYTLGEIRGHYIVIAVLPDGEYGTSSAACVARDMLHSFPNIRFGLMVGIGGGVPTKQDIRLGDVIVSSSRSGHSGLLQYDFGKEVQDHEFHQAGFLNQPPPILRTAVSGLRTQYKEQGHQLRESIERVLEGNKRLKPEYTQPPTKSDRLYDSQYTHIRDSQSNCDGLCDESKLIRRSQRSENEDDPAIHYGLIASGNRLVKNAILRDKLAGEKDVLCFEMEAAGLMNQFPCLVIRGVCDYADSHKNKEWQGYAAMMAAAYTKDLLHQIVPQRVAHERNASEAIREIQGKLTNVSNDIDKIHTITSGSALQIRSLAHNIDLEKLPVAKGAEFETYMDQHEDQCLPGTRAELLHSIDEWAKSPRGKCIFWLNGLAGTGKSTISRTVAKSFKKQGLLEASFFFKRGESYRGSATRFFTTIANQLTRIPGLLAAIMQVVRDNPEISDKPLKEQFEKLIHQPLQNLERSKQTSPLLIVIDALDECESDNDNDIKVILALLPRLQEANSTQVRFFITSRPELPIRLGFMAMGSSYQDLSLHEIEKPMIERDLTVFLHHKLTRIRGDRELPANWPGDTAIQALITMSAPLFIFAATICRLLEDHDLDPAQCLTEVLKFKNEGSKLDQTYLPVFKRLLHKLHQKGQKQWISEIREVIGIILILENSLSVTSLSQLTGISIMSIKARLNSLHSVLDIPTDKERPIGTFHLSFRDFLLDLDTREKTPFWIDEKDAHYSLTTRCLVVMRQRLHKNMCKLQSYGIERTTMTSDNTTDLLPPELQYSCRYWTHHLAQSRNPMNRSHEILAFLNTHFLHWVEVMSLLGTVSEALQSIRTLQSLSKDTPEICQLLRDGERFILRNRQILDIAPLQIYASGLLFTPEKAILRQKFVKDIPAWIYKCPRVQDRWGPELQTLEGHSNSVMSVAFSPDGWQLASGSDDNTIKIWDPTTGHLKHTLEGHSNSVMSVAFSPDGRQLASGSNDKTIKIWDPTTGHLKHTLEGHSNSVMSVAFSPDGWQLASGSDDNTIKIWDPTTGHLKHTLEGHSDSVKSVAFSPYGRQLASGSNDKTIKIWDPATGHLRHTLEGHSSWVTSVAFSPDGRQLASCSRGFFGNPIKIWDPATGHVKHTLEGHSIWVTSVAFSPDGRQLATCSAGFNDPIKIWDPATGRIKHTLEGHSIWVTSVAFSPDGQHLATGSKDKTIKIWDPTTSRIKHTLEGHSDSVESIAFSPDGRQLASGSKDRTIKIWDPTTGHVKHTLEGHSNSVMSVAFSPDGHQLASGSKGLSNNTIKIWDPATGHFKYTLEGHSSWVTSVAFSPDGRQLASGSYDKTIKIWDPAIGHLKHTLEGHSHWINSVAFSPDGRQLASGSNDKTIKIWDPATGHLKHTLDTRYAVTSIRFSENASFLITNLGNFDVQPKVQNPYLSASTSHSEISIQSGQWVSIQAKPKLWLPSEYRPSDAVVYKNVLAVGCGSGRVLFMHFNI